MDEKKTWRDTFRLVTRAPEGTKRFERFCPGFHHSDKMGDAMAYMYSAYDPIADKWYRVTFATLADLPQEDVDRTAEAMMENKIRGYYEQMLARTMALAC